MPGNCDGKEFSALQNSRLFYFFLIRKKKPNPKSCFMCCPGNSVPFAHSSCQRELILNVPDFSSSE